MEEQENKNLQESSSTAQQISDFMQEQIKQRSLSSRKMTRRFFQTVGLALVFGLVACLIFVLLQPVITRVLFPQESAVSFPEETAEEISPEELIASEQEKEEAAASQTAEQIHEQVKALLEEYPLTLDQYSQVHTSLYDLTGKYSNSVVTISAITSDQNMWGDTVENQSSSAGVFLAETEDVLLAAAFIPSQESGVEYRITLSDGSSAGARIRETDAITGLSILEVNKNDFSKETLEKVRPLELGSSAKVEGEPVIAIGSVTGQTGSFGYGVIRGRQIMDLADSEYSLLTTDIYGSTAASGVLVSLDGKIIGLIDMNHRVKDMPNMICGVGITELRGLITKLSNSRQKAYLGIHGSTITEEISKAQDLPVGLYVTEVDMDSPAMAAGLASGDILIQAGETPVTGYRDLINVLMVSEPEDTVRLKLRRSNNGSWNEMQVTVTLAVYEKEN
ncbi:MAG: serine protease [Lachnospiraceae bacterium]|jgi:S1-C subfamily serine protease|nr:serine protease [Lachnospiraceae bacterium]